MLLFSYFKECVFKPRVFFNNQKDNPDFVRAPWIILPIVTFILIVLVTWLSEINIVKNLELDFEGFLIVHTGPIITGLLLSLFFWFRTWIPLKAFNLGVSSRWQITAWCNLPFLVSYFLLFIIFLIYRIFFYVIPEIPEVANPTIFTIKLGYILTIACILLSEIWCLFLLFNATTVFDPSKVRKLLITATILFLIPRILSFIL